MNPLLPGTEVQFRGLRWEVVFAQPAGEQQLFRLRCIEHALSGRLVDVLVPFETIEPARTDLDPTHAGRLQEFGVYHEAFLLEQALGPHAFLAAQPGRLIIAPYQLVPVLRALAMPRPRLLLADDVGLGKTIEAGLVLAELIARRRAHRILIVSPAGLLLDQWRREMRERFGLRFREIDAATLQQIRYSTELGANPFDHEALGIVSIDFAKQEKVLADIERSQWDVVVIDEAHHCVSLGTAGDREDSQRRTLAEVLARRSDALLLLTATPHDGFDPHFASLVELLDPSLLDGRGSLAGDRWKAHAVRRLKRHIRDPKTGEPLFRERHVAPEPVVIDRRETPKFAEYHEALLELVMPRIRRALRTRAFGEVLAFISLLKRSASTARACAKTLDSIADRLDDLAKTGEEDKREREQRLKTLRDLVRRRERFGALSFEAEQDQAQLEAEDMAADLADSGAEELELKLHVETKGARRDRDRKKRLDETLGALRRLAEVARAAEGEDPKVARAVEVLVGIRVAEPNANVLVYTEYTDSQDALVEKLLAAVAAGTLSGEVVALRGADNDETRRRVTEAFGARDGIILVSTDATAEGLNLHDRCHHLVHLELPYNPNRIEQRNGRIDRFGQKHDPQIRYLVLRGTFEDRLLSRLVTKVEAQRKRLGFVPDTLGPSLVGESTGRLLEALESDQPTLFAVLPGKPIDTSARDEETSEAYRGLLAEIDDVLGRFERVAKTQTWMVDTSIGGEPSMLQAADAAHDAGQKQGAIDLLGFVIAAVRAESAEPSATKKLLDGTWELKLPPAWFTGQQDDGRGTGFEDLPGWDEQARLLRVTTDVSCTKNSAGAQVGYLGRAHPVVRRALDRVRQLQHGSRDAWVDRRVATARGDAPEPELLFTWLARVQSDAGRELERVIAVRVSKSGKATPLVEPSDWTHLLDASRGLPSANVWERQFASWSTLPDEAAQQAARDAFAPIAAEFEAEHRGGLDEARAGLATWLADRAAALCGEVERQAALFAEPTARVAAPLDDEGRLAAFAQDREQSARKREEARQVVRLYQDRLRDIERRAKLEPPSITPLGLLMLVPATSARGAS